MAGHKYTLSHNVNYDKKEWELTITDNTTDGVIETFGPYFLEFNASGPLKNICKKQFDLMMRQQIF